MAEVPYTPVPYVRPAYTPDTRSIQDLMRLAAAARVQSTLQQGQQRGQMQMNIGSLIADALGNIQQSREQKAALQQRAAMEQQKLAQEDRYKRSDFALRAAQFDETARARQQAEARATSQDQRMAANDAVENTLPGPIDPTSAQTLRQYPGTAPLVSQQTTLEARPVSPDMAPMAPPSDYAVRGQTPKEVQQAQTFAATQKAAEAAALRQATNDTRLTGMAAEAARHNRVMEKRPVAGMGSNEMPLSSGGLDWAAAKLRITGNNSILNRYDPATRTTIINEVARQNEALGRSPAASVQQEAAFKADASSLSKMRLMASSASAFEKKAIAQTGLVEQLSNAVPRTQYPIINDKLVKGERWIAGDKNAQLFGNALLTFTNEYAKIMEGSTGSVAGSSESARRDAAELISTALNKGTIKATLDQMRWEMKQTINGYDSVIGEITGRMGGDTGGDVPPPTPSTRVYYDANGKAIKKP